MYAHLVVSWPLAFSGLNLSGGIALSDRDIFGEMALIDAAQRHRGGGHGVKLVPVGEKQFLFLVSRTPHFALNVMRVLARRPRAQNSAV